MTRLRAEQIRHLRNTARHDPETVYNELAVCSADELSAWLHETNSTLGRDPSTLLAETIAVAAHGVRDPAVVRQLVSDLLEEIQTADRPTHGTLRTFALLSETRPELLREAIDPLCNLIEVPRELPDSRLRQYALQALRNIVYGNPRVTLTSAQFQFVLDHCTAAPTSREQGLAIGVVRAALELQAVPRESVSAFLEMLASPDGESLRRIQPTLVTRTIETLARTYPAVIKHANTNVEQILGNAPQAETQTAIKTPSAPADDALVSQSQDQPPNSDPSGERSVAEILRQYVPEIGEHAVSPDGPSMVVEALQSGNATTEILATLWHPEFWCCLDPSIQHEERATEITEATDLTRLPGVGEQLAEQLRDPLATATSGPVTVRNVQEAPPAALRVKHIEATRYRSLKRGRFHQTILELVISFYADELPPQIDVAALLRVILTAAAVNPPVVQHALDASVGAALEVLSSNTETQNRTTLLRLVDLLEMVYTTAPHLASDIVAGVWYDSEPWSDTWRCIVNPDTAVQRRWAIGFLAHLVSTDDNRSVSKDRDQSATRTSALAAVYRNQDFSDSICSEIALVLQHESAKEATAILAGLTEIETPTSFDLRARIRDTFASSE